MPEQPNHCTGCGELMPYTNAAYYCSEKCMNAVLGIEPYPFVEKPAAKSSTSVMKASVCQRCGCKLDGKTMTRICLCVCHKKGPKG